MTLSAKPIPTGIIAGAAIALVAVFAPPSLAGTVNIAGTHTIVAGDLVTGSYKPFKIDTSVLFNPLAGPVTVTGSVDISGLSGNATTYFGLISKVEYDQWLAEGHDPTDAHTDYFGFLDTAYAGFNTGGGGRLGLGQQTLLGLGDTLQSYVAGGLGDTVSQFTVTFEDTKMTLELGLDQAMQAYQDTWDYPEWVNQGLPSPPPTRPTDWSEGAYAFVGTWFDDQPGSSSFDLTFEGPEIAAVPEPGALALFGIGLVGVGVARRRRRAA